MAVRVGVIGCGRIARGAHLPNYARLEGVEIAALCDTDERALSAVAGQYGVSNIFTRPQDLLDKGGVDAVSVCTPNVYHKDIVMAALRKRKHVLCEKPMAMNAGEAEAMLEEARKTGVVNMVSFTHRFNPTMAFVREVIEEGRLGRLYHFRVLCSVERIMNPEVGLEWRLIREQTGSGALGDLASHMVDLSTFLMGNYSGPIMEVSGVTTIFIKQRKRLDGSGLGEVTADDAAAFIASYEKGVMGVFEVSRFSPGRVHIEIDGSKGSLIYDSSRPNTVLVKLEESFGDYFKEFRPVEVPKSFLDRLGYSPEMFFNEIKCFVDGVREGVQVKPDFYDGLICQKVLDAVLASSEEKVAKRIS
ncbi:MAG TPA: Gfo/Idh/MocA family oxidoreductase [Firmicutes bacterium]|nr:Gfo/Idh/MocA family oxidoreductase [Bacillota bacterium]